MGPLTSFLRDELGKQTNKHYVWKYCCTLGLYIGNLRPCCLRKARAITHHCSCEMKLGRAFIARLYLKGLFAKNDKRQPNLSQNLQKYELGVYQFLRKSISCWWVTLTDVVASCWVVLENYFDKKTTLAAVWRARSILIRHLSEWIYRFFCK